MTAQKKKVIVTPPIVFVGIVCLGIILFFILSRSNSYQPHTLPVALLPEPTLRPTLTSEPLPTLGANFQPQTQLEQEAFDAMVRYLEQYKYPNSISHESIDDYRITSISNVHFSGTQLRFGVTFSTKQHDLNDPLDPAATGNGSEMSPDGWYLDKEGAAEADMRQGSYIVTGIATGSIDKN